MSELRSVVEHVRLAAQRLGAPGQRILIGVSGGADSVALVCALDRLKCELDLQPIICHVNHGWRGAESEGDAAWVAGLAHGLSLPVRIEQLTPPPASEEAARNARYQVFEIIARQENCTQIALAHTADDQVETALHRLIRGTGVRGLAGIPQSRSVGSGVQVVRPLLEVTRQDIEAWLLEINQEWRTDSTNLQVAFTRNRLRHELLPLLRQHFNPNVDLAILRLVDNARDLNEWLGSLTSELLKTAVIDYREDMLVLDRSALRSAHRLVTRELLVTLWQQQNWPQQDLTATHWSTILDSLESTGIGPMVPGGIRVETTARTLVFRCIR